ncbi:MAG: hypothetical protein CML68_06875 [Rhodobacteraceae bacterium]|nr:hypothetical protein [Paracoccaceae bacterium]
MVHQERFGAYLVTGQRGAGKTSFVHYCLQEYTAAAYQRSIRVIGNAPFAESVFLAILGLIACFCFALSLQATQLLSQNALLTLTNSAGVVPSQTIAWVWLPLVVLSAGYLGMMRHAFRTARALSGRYDTPAKRMRWLALNLFIIALVPVFFVGVHFIWDAFPDHLGDAVFFGGVCAMLTALHVRTTKAAFGSSFPIKTYEFKRFQVFNCVLGLLGAVVFTIEIDKDSSVLRVLYAASAILVLTYMSTLTGQALGRLLGERRQDAPPPMSIMHWLLHPLLVSGLGLFAFAFLIEPYFNGFSLPSSGRLLLTDLRLVAPTAGSPDMTWQTLGIEGGQTYMKNYIIVLLAQAFLLLVQRAVIARFGWRCKGHPSLGETNEDGSPKVKDINNYLRPFAPFAFIMILRSGLTVLLAFCGLAPLLGLIAVGYFCGVEPDRVMCLPPAPTAKDGLTWILTVLPENARTLPRGPDILLFFLALAAFYRVEQQWIAKDQRSHRVDGSLGLLGRAPDHPQDPEAWPSDVDTGAKKKSKATPADGPRHFAGIRETRGNLLLNPENDFISSYRWTRRRDVYRQIERASLPWLVYSIRNPSLAVWVNLGFDNLAHSRIIEAMLRQLRAAYAAKFLSLRSPVGAVTFGILLLVALLFTSLAAKSFFHFATNQNGDPLVVPYETDSDGANLGSPDYCAFFHLNPELAPNAKSLLCALPLGNRLLTVLYAPLLELNVDFAIMARGVPVSVSGTNSTFPTHGIGWKSGEDWFIGAPIDRKGVPLLKELPCEDPAKPETCLTPETSAAFFRSDLSQSLLVNVLLDRNLGLPLLAQETSGNQTTVGMDPNVLAESRVALAYWPTTMENAPPTMRVYHVVLFLVILWMMYSINKRLNLVPYRGDLARMDDQLLLIKGAESIRTSTAGLGSLFSRYIPSTSRERQVDARNDPRLVEQEFIELLTELKPYQPSNEQRSLRDWLSVRPEITFVLDEMDKLSGSPDAEFVKDGPGEAVQEENSRDRARSKQLHMLLADMKRLISGGTARFIFIGGRLYHDEWLADQAQRSPILNAVFNGHIYLPSLLADRSHPFGRFNDRIAEFVILTYRNARHRLDHWIQIRRNTARPFDGSTEEPIYVQSELPYEHHPRRLAAMAHHVGLSVLDGEAGRNGEARSWSIAGRNAGPEILPNRHVDGQEQHLMTMGEQEFLDQFLNFLTYRSAGNPKKLKELMEDLTQPASHALSLPGYPRGRQKSMRWSSRGLRNRGHDVLLLDDHALYRMQFIDMLYRHLMDHLEGQILERDDKVSISIFYLMDFLMKFHNRGFSWTNLQRVDELSHIHRAPDLRSLMSLLVQLSSERFLHKVLNGIYGFRFRSDFAREIDYLSRISKEEMAALNFTLDESQSLKGIYQQTINTGERENVDTIAGLGELYEYDQDHEVARNYYRRAIAVLDATLAETLRQSSKVSSILMTDEDTHGSPRVVADHELMGLGEIMMSEEAGGDNPLVSRIVRSHFPWVVSRLRLMLQIAQSYEQERHLERAKASYMHAAEFSERVLKWYARIRTNGSVPAVEPQNFSVFHQAALAVAWIKEKDPENVDQSVHYAEDWLKRMHLREGGLLGKPARFDGTHDSGMIFVQSALAHVRVGDIYFFKGRVSFRDHGNSFIPLMKGAKENGNNPDFRALPKLGFIPGAQRNYAIAFWLLRRFIARRVKGGTINLPLTHGNDEERLPAFDVSMAQPEHVEASIAETATDLSDAILGQGNSIACALRMHESRQVADTGLYADFSQDTVTQVVNWLRHLQRVSIKRFRERFGHQGESDNLWFGADKPDHLIDVPVRWTPRYGFSEDLRKVLTPDAGTASCWVGRFRYRNEDDKVNPGPASPLARFTKNGGAQHTLSAFRFFNDFAIQSFALSDQHINAANELFLQADALITSLWTGRYLEFLKNDPIAGHDVRKLMNLPEKGAEPAPPTDPVDEIRVACEAFLALDEAFRNIRIAERPSVSRMSRNHGNPDKFDQPSGTPEMEHDPFARFTKAKVGGKDATDEEKAKEIRAAQFEYWVDYHQSQAWRDDPRAITLASSLVLALLGPNAGRPAVTTAIRIYDGILRKYAFYAFMTKYEAAGDQSEKKGKNFVEKSELDHALKTPGKPLDTDQTARAIAKELYEIVLYGLHAALDRNRFPILNRLNGLKVLADAAILYEEPDAVYPAEKEENEKEGEKGAQAQDGKKDGTPIERKSLAELKEKERKLISERPNTQDQWKELDECRQAIDALIEQTNENWRNTFKVPRATFIGRRTKEMLSLAEIYGSEMHFSPHKLGVTMGLAYLWTRQTGRAALYEDQTVKQDQYSEDENKKRDKFLRNLNQARDLELDHKPLLDEVLLTQESLGELALAKLRRAEQMVSMGRADYQNIAHMSFLNDDFNDRAIHFHHGMAMFQLDMAALLARALYNGLFQRTGGREDSDRIARRHSR